jgi:hypothetical protein
VVKKSNLKIVFQYRGLLLVFLTLRNLALRLMRNFFLFFSLFFLSFTTQAKLTLPAILSDNMVLQQNSVVKLWGTSSLKKSVTVKVSWSSTWFQTWTKADGSWEIQLFTPAGSFQEHWIKISDAADQKNLQNVLIGEVWLCSGQSNMAMTYRGYKNQPITDAEQSKFSNSSGYDETSRTACIYGVRLVFYLLESDAITLKERVENLKKELIPDKTSNSLKYIPHLPFNVSF